MRSCTVVGIGELLWDVFPARRRLGGAPVNFTCHCRQLGARGVPVSCIGEDADGRDILEAVSALGLEVDYIQRHPSAPTGTVQVVLDLQRKPHYEIKEQVAWDFIRPAAALLRLAPAVDAVCFGSLAQRSGISRATIRRFVSSCPAAALRIFDVNLRQAFYTKAVIAKSLGAANVLKVGDEELPVLAAMFGLRGSVTDQIRRLIEDFELRLAAYTRGENGSLLVTADEVVDHPGCKTEAVDTVGAGDSYTAALCMGLLRQRPLEEVIQHATEVSAFVCSHPGATPILPDELVKAMSGGSSPSGRPGFTGSEPPAASGSARAGRRIDTQRVRKYLE